MDYAVTVKGIRRKELLALDDEFAKEVSDVDTIEALRERVREDLQKGAEEDADHEVRHELLQRAGATRVKAAPDVLVDQEVDRRLEEFVRRLMEQGVDPMQANVDWQEFRERQRQARPTRRSRARSCSTRSRRRESHRGDRRGPGRARSRSSPNAPAARRPPCGRGSRRRGARPHPRRHPPRKDR